MKKIIKKFIPSLPVSSNQNPFLSALPTPEEITAELAEIEKGVREMRDNPMAYKEQRHQERMAAEEQRLRHDAEMKAMKKCVTEELQQPTFTTKVDEVQHRVRTGHASDNDFKWLHAYYYTGSESGAKSYLAKMLDFENSIAQFAT